MKLVLCRCTDERSDAIQIYRERGVAVSICFFWSGSFNGPLVAAAPFSVILPPMIASASISSGRPENLPCKSRGGLSRVYPWSLI